MPGQETHRTLRWVGGGGGWVGGWVGWVRGWEGNVLVGAGERVDGGAKAAYVL